MAVYLIHRLWTIASIAEFNPNDSSWNFIVDRTCSESTRIIQTFPSFSAASILSMKLWKPRLPNIRSLPQERLVNFNHSKGDGVVYMKWIFPTYLFWSSEVIKFSKAPPKAFGSGAESCEFEKTDGTIKIITSEYLLSFWLGCLRAFSYILKCSWGKR